MPPYAIPDPTGQRTWPTSDSYIKFADEPEPWAWLFPETRSSFVIRVVPISSHSRAIAYAASLQGDDYLEQLRAALRDSDTGQARHYLAVLLGLLEVAAEQLCGSSSESLGILH
jgi:hypothetical protein